MSKTEHNYEIFKIEQGLVFYTRYQGVLTRDLFFEISYARTGDPDYEHAVFIINDMLAADLSMLDVDAIREMAGRVRQVLTLRPHMVVIVIAEDKLAYGLSRIFRGSTGPASGNLHVVQSKEAAFELVGAIRVARGI